MPAEHWVQLAAPASEYVPSAQLAQLLIIVAPAFWEYVPARQLVHVAAPWRLHVPATHVAQLLFEAWPASALAVPALQLTQALWAVMPL